MPIPVSRVGVQSWCYRKFPTTQAFTAEVKKLCMTRVELCGVHADFSKPETFAAVVADYKAAGVTIGSIGVQGFSGNEAEERKWFQFAKLAGATTISADFKPESTPNAFRVAEKLADEFNINLAIHNHGGYHWLGSAQALQWVFGQTSKRIGLCLDTAWALDARENPVSVVERFGDRLYGLHLKDFTFDRARKSTDVVIGTGNLDLKALGAALDKVGYAGNTVIEYELDEENPTPAITHCIAKLHAAWGT